MSAGSVVQTASQDQASPRLAPRPARARPTDLDRPARPQLRGHPRALPDLTSRRATRPLDDDQPDHRRRSDRRPDLPVRGDAAGPHRDPGRQGSPPPRAGQIGLRPRRPLVARRGQPRDGSRSNRTKPPPRKGRTGATTSEAPGAGGRAGSCSAWPAAASTARPPARLPPRPVRRHRCRSSTSAGRADRR